MHYDNMMKRLDRGIVWDFTVDGQAASDEFEDTVAQYVHHLIAPSQLDSQKRS